MEFLTKNTYVIYNKNIIEIRFGSTTMIHI